MPRASTVWTADQLGDFPDDGMRYEIIDGELLVNPSPSWRHQGIAMQLTVAIATYLENSNSGWLVPDVDVQFDPTHLVRPDLVVTPLVAGRAPRSLAEAGRLLLVVEILSPASTLDDRHRKLALYMRMSVPEYWIVDPEERVVHRWRAGVPSAERCEERVEWRAGPGVEALVIDLRALFERVGG